MRSAEEAPEAAPLAVLVIASGEDGLQVGMASRLVDELSGHDPVGSAVDTVFPGSHLPGLVIELTAYDSDAARHRLNRLALLQPPARIIAEVVGPAMYEIGGCGERSAWRRNITHHRSSMRG